MLKRLFVELNSAAPGAVKIDVGEFDRATGHTYAELGAVFRQLQRTQRPVASPPVGHLSRFLALVDSSRRTGEDETSPDLFAGIDTSWNNEAEISKVAKTGIGQIAWKGVTYCNSCHDLADDNNGALQTNRLRLNFSARVAENVSFTGRLSMYKVFGDSTGVQTFNGSPTSMNIDGTTNGVPNSDVLRVDRAYFSWNKIGGSKWYLSIGRRPSTGGPPMNFRQDEERGGHRDGGTDHDQNGRRR